MGSQHPACAAPKLDARPSPGVSLAELGGSSVLVDQSTEDSVTSDRGVEGDDGGGVVGWWVLAEALVRAVVIEVAHVLVNNSVGVSVVVDQQPVGALGADTADEPFRIAVCPWRARRDLDHLDVVGGEDGIEGIGELGVPITDQETERADLVAQVHQQIAGSLGRPGRGRVSGHPEQVHPAGAHLHHEQNVESAQPDGVEGEEVGGQQTRRLSAQESSPPSVGSARCWAESGGGQDPADGAGAHAVPEPGQFALDSAMSPGGILLCQVQYQLTDLLADRWAA